MKVFIALQVMLIILAFAVTSKAARLKDITNIRGVRSNQLVGYGIVVGLNGTGDGKSEYTNKSIVRMLDRLGMKVSPKAGASKNVAAVILTAELPPFARSGNRMDITVNTLGDASSLRGGTLIQTPLRAADQQVYAVAQGAVIVGHSSSGVHETVARLPNGAIIERDIGKEFAGRKMFRMTLNNPDFTTAARISKRINMELAGKYATAVDGATINIVSPSAFEGKGVELLAVIESVDIEPDTRAKIVVNEKTGTVVIGEGVKISRVAISHGDLTLKVGGAKSSKDGDRVIEVKEAVNLKDVVKSMNRLGVSPRDLITILQNIKAAGALQGDLEVL